MADNVQYGCITEQGDLGLGFDVLNEQDQKSMAADAEKKDEKKNDK